MKIPANILGAKHILLAIFVVAGYCAIFSSTIHIAAVWGVSGCKGCLRNRPRLSSVWVNAIPSCEKFSRNISRRFFANRPKNLPRMLEYLIYKSKEKQSLISSMELDGKMQQVECIGCSILEEIRFAASSRSRFPAWEFLCLLSIRRM